LTATGTDGSHHACSGVGQGAPHGCQASRSIPERLRALGRPLPHNCRNRNPGRLPRPPPIARPVQHASLILPLPMHHGVCDRLGSLVSGLAASKLVVLKRCAKHPTSCVVRATVRHHCVAGRVLNALVTRCAADPGEALPAVPTAAGPFSTPPKPHPRLDAQRYRKQADPARSPASNIRPYVRI